jgi:serine/threonine-protein kinase
VTVQICPHCGAPIGPGALFCMKCGTDISGQQPGVSTRMVGTHAARVGSTTVRLSQADLLARLRDATLGDYEILAELGHGGMATVYLAHDIQLDRKVAIKVLSPRVAQGEGMVERFRLEARTAASLSHPHIIPIHAVRETDQLVYFVMKFVVGRPLDAILREAAPLPVPTVRTILAKVADALGYAHRNGVVHRDIKPANIMIDAEGMPIVTDFGIAKVADRHGLTLTGTALGTPTYMSPEQCNADTITGASDQYSLGVVAFEMLVGRPLYEGESVVTIMFKHVHEPPPPPEAFGPSVPADLARAVIRMLQKGPNQRWPAMEEALPALRGTDASHEDMVRTQMIELAKGGTNAELLARLSTPRSPIPVKRGPRTPTPPAATVSAPSGRAAARPRSRWVWIGAAVLTLAGAGVLAVLQPWRGPAPATAAPGSSAVDQSAAAPPDPVVPPPAEVTPPVGAVTPPDPAAVTAPVVQLVRILDAPLSLPEGQVAALRAVVLDQQGRAMSRPVRWSSSDPLIAVLRADGRLSAVAPGRVTITAAADGRRADVQLTVTPVVAGVTVSPASGELEPGQSLILTVTALGRDGRALADQSVAWRSSNEQVAVVSSVGRVTAVGVGAAVISAAAAGQVGTAQIGVAAPPPAAPAAPAAEKPPPVVEEDAPQAIAAVVQAYARALESKDLARVKALYPTISPALEGRTRDALDAMEDVRVRLATTQVSVSGNTALAVVSGEWTYRGGRLDVNNRYRLERRSGGWVIVNIE